MAEAWGVSTTGKSVAQPIAASDGILGVFSGTAATPPSHTVLFIGHIPDSANPFGVGTFAEHTSIQDGAANETFRLRVAPATSTWSFRLQNTAGTARTTDVTISNPGTNLDGMRNARFVAAATFDTSTRILTSYVVHGVTSRVTDSFATTALTAGVGLRLAASVVQGVVANRYFPGTQCLTAVLSGALTQANLEAIWDANDPAFALHTYRTSILWATQYGMLGELIGTTFNLPGNAVAADNRITYNSGTQTSWYGVAPSAPTVTGSITYADPLSVGFTIDKTIVPNGGSDITTEVQNRAANPALYAVGTQTYTKPTHVLVSSNSRGSRTNTDPLNQQTQNTSYHSSQPAQVDANWAGGLAMYDDSLVVGHFRVPKVTGSSAFGGTLSAWSGDLPSTGTVTLKSGRGTDAPDKDFSRVSIGSESAGTVPDPAVGPGQYVAISASGGIDYLFSACGGIGPTDRIRVWALVMKYPGSATVTTQKVSHASSSSTVPFGSAAANWASGTTHGSASSPYTLDNQYADSSVVSYSHPNLTVLSDPGVGTGDVVVVDRGGTPCIGYINDPSSSPALGMEFTMGSGTGVPQAGDALYYGHHVEWLWVYVDFDGSETPNPWRGIRLTAGASGFPVNVVRVGVQKLSAALTPAPGLITWPMGWGGHGYAEQLNAMPFLPDADDGLNAPERFVSALREPMEFGTSQKVAVVVPAQQGSTAASSGSMLDTFTAGGWTARELAFCADFTNANNTSSFTTQAFQDFAAYGLTAGPERGIVAVGIFDDAGVPFSQLCTGMLADIAHKSTTGCLKWGTEFVRVLSPVADGGGGAALPGTSAGGMLGGRNRPGRARVSR